MVDKLSSKDLFAILIAILVAVFFFVPISYTSSESYYENEPYIVSVPYEDLIPITTTEEYIEKTPISYEECKNDFEINPQKWINKGLNNFESILEGDIDVLFETCENLIRLEPVVKTKDKIEYKSVTKYREETKYRQVEKQKIVTKKDTLFNQWASK